MPAKLPAIRTSLILAASVAILSACASGDHRPGDRPGSGATSRLDREPPEALWHLRAGLNVAALSCRGKGRKSVRGAYHRLLSKHRNALDRAYKGEQRRHGKSGLDRHQTQLYNRFARQRSPARFCKAASAIAGRANNMDSVRLAAASPKLLGELRANLR